jgi:hypothetical protein
MPRSLGLYPTVKIDADPSTEKCTEQDSKVEGRYFYMLASHRGRQTTDIVITNWIPNNWVYVYIYSIARVLRPPSNEKGGEGGGIEMATKD